MASEHWLSLETVFARALELSPAARASYLDEACAGDPALRGEVEALVAAAPEARAFFGGLEDVVRTTPHEALAGGLGAGAMVGPYEVLEEIGRGGMGVVYRARDSRLDRLVALKLLPTWLSGEPRARERLVTEARAASAIDHPNIGTLYDVEDLGDAGLCLVLAHYDGESLKERLARGLLDPDEAAGIAEQVAEGLAAAHDHGIVHRDIKPANLFLTEAGLVKILDFGIAKVLGAEAAATDAGLGTAAYMSPEQARGDAVDHRTDLWSLGVVLYEMLACRRPFAAERAAAVTRAILEDEPPLLRRPTGEAVPPGLARVVAGLLAKDPAARTASAKAVAEDLERWRRGAPIRARAPIRRRARLAVAVAVLAALGVAGGVWSLRREEAPAAPASERVAVFPFSVRGAPEYAYMGEGIVDLLSTSLDGAGAMRSVDPRAVLGALTDNERLDLEAERGATLAQRLGADRFIMGDIVEAEGRLRIHASLYQGGRGAAPLAQASVEGDATRIFNLIDELTAQLLLTGHEGPAGQLAHIAAVTTTSLPALKAYLDGEQALREGRFGEAVEVLRRAVEEDSTFALAHYRLSKAASWDRRYGLALESAERAARHAGRLAPHVRHLVEANLANWRGDRRGAERLYRLVLASSPDNVEAWHELGEILFHYNLLRGRSVSESRGPFERALVLDPDQSETRIHLFEMAAWDGDRAQVEAHYRILAAAGPLDLEWRAVRAFAVGGRESRERILAEMAAAGDRELYRAVEGVVRLAPTDPGATRAARLLTEPHRPRDWRAMGEWLLALIDLGGGRWREASRALDRAQELEPAWALEHRALWAAMPYAAVPRLELEAIRTDLEAWDAAAEPASMNRLAAIHDELHPLFREHLLGHVSARLGDRDEALRRAEALEAPGIPGPRQPLARWLAASVRAHALWGAGRSRDALAALESSPSPASAEQTRSPILAGFLERYLRAEILRSLDRNDEALAWYESVGDNALYGVPFRAMTHLRRAEILEAKGEREMAASHYTRFLALWRSPDDPLRPTVVAAGSRLAALGGPATH